MRLYYNDLKENHRRRQMLPVCFQSAVPPKMRRNFRNRKIASVPVKGPAFSDPKGRQALCRGFAASRDERHIYGVASP